MGSIELAAHLFQTTKIEDQVTGKLKVNKIETKALI